MFKVEIPYYKELNKGALAASFSIILTFEAVPDLAITVFDCKYFKVGDKSWISYPARENKHADGRKSEFFPNLKISNLQMDELIKKLVIEELQKKEGENDKKENLQSNAPPLW